MLGSQISAASAGAAVPVATSTLSDRYCNAFVDYFTVSFVAEFAAALAKGFADAGNSADQKKKQPSPDEIRSTFLLVFSPKLERVTGVMAQSGERVLRPVFRKQQAVFAHGSALLQDAGLTQKQIDVLAAARVDFNNTALEKLTGKIHIDAKKLTSLAKKFQRELGTLDRTKSASGAAAAFQRVGSECGAFPSSAVDCSKVLPQSEAAAILGTTVTQDGKKCAYEAPEPASGLTPKVAVEVYDSARAYDKLTKSVTGQAVQGIGDRAVAHDGYSAYTNVATCGRTLYVAAGKRTIAVALCLPNDAAVTDTQLVDVASGVLQRLG
jgi:hypothetical protein